MIDVIAELRHDLERSTSALTRLERAFAELVAERDRLAAALVLAEQKEATWREAAVARTEERDAARLSAAQWMRGEEPAKAATTVVEHTVGVFDAVEAAYGPEVRRAAVKGVISALTDVSPAVARDLASADEIIGAFDVLTRRLQAVTLEQFEQAWMASIQVRRAHSDYFAQCWKEFHENPVAFLVGFRHERALALRAELFKRIAGPA